MKELDSGCWILDAGWTYGRIVHYLLIPDT
jgi:hypothetical protein